MFFSSLQTSLWLHFFGDFPPPPLWVALLSYWSLYRKLAHSIVMLYILPLYLAPLSFIEISTFTAVCFLSFTILYTIKKRYFWKGSGYYMLITAFTTLLVGLLFYITSQFEPRPAIKFFWLNSFVQPLEILILSPLLYKLFQTIDFITGYELPSESGVFRI
jgi:hypothetical protein